MQNLRDKLLKAGLVTSEEAQRAEADKTPKARPRSEPPGRRERPARPPDSRALRPASEPAVPRLPPLPGSKEHQRLEAAKQRELAEKLRALVYSAQVPVEVGAHTFHFVTRKGRLRRLELSEAQAKLLEEGKLAVVERQEPAQIEHSLVPPETAEQMAALFPKAVRFLNRPEAPIGFLSDEELKRRQEQEAAQPPEAESPAADGETWIAIKRAPPDGAQGGEQ